MKAIDDLSSLPVDNGDQNFPSLISYNQQWIDSKFPTAMASDIDQQCLIDTQEYLAAYQNRRSWAIKSKLTIH